MKIHNSSKMRDKLHNDISKVQALAHTHTHETHAHTNTERESMYQI